MAAMKHRSKRRLCGQCGNDLVRVQPARPTDDLTWNLSPQGKFYCEKCDLMREFPLIKDEPRDIELSPRVRA